MYDIMAGVIPHKGPGQLIEADFPRMSVSHVFIH